MTLSSFEQRFRLLLIHCWSVEVLDIYLELEYARDPFCMQVVVGTFPPMSHVWSSHPTQSQSNSRYTFMFLCYPFFRFFWVYKLCVVAYWPNLQVWDLSCICLEQQCPHVWFYTQLVVCTLHPSLQCWPLNPRKVYAKSIELKIRLRSSVIEFAW